MAGGGYGVALESYRSGAQLLQRGPELALEESDSGAELDDLLARSLDLENAIAGSLGAGEEDVRDLAAQQMVGGAALDFAAAADVLRSAQPAALEDAGEAGSTFAETYAELKPIMEANTALGATATIEPVAVVALDEADPAVALREAAEKAIDGISADAAGIAAGGVDGLIGLPTDALLAGAGQAADRLLGPLYDKAGLIVKRALKFLAKGVSKLLRLLGPFEAKAREKLKEWLGGFTKEKLVAFAVEAILETAKLKEEVRGMADGAAGKVEPERLGAAARESTELAARFGKHKKVIGVVTKVLGKLQAFIVGLGHLGMAALAGIYLAIVAYGVWVGGDFVDWHRTADDGRLDLVHGVRGTVQAATTPAAG